MDLTIPEGALPFLTRAGWAGATHEPLPGDASFRRYVRVRKPDGACAMLMIAPPPREDPGPFLRVAHWLDGNGLRPPRILAEDAGAGFVLLEDFGDVRMGEYVAAWPDDETPVYHAAIDTLLTLHRLPPGPFTGYGMREYIREVRLFIEWYCPARALYVDNHGWIAAWEEVLAPVLARQRPGVTVLRDYHAENIMLLGGIEQQGLLDFQDALVGHRAYDLVSLLQDARRDVSSELETAMFAYYCQGASASDGGFAIETFLSDYARLGAQRNAKILGIFVRLWKRDAKPRYLDLIARVWMLFERDLAHPALAPVKAWVARNIPADMRAPDGLTAARFTR